MTPTPLPSSGLPARSCCVTEWCPGGRPAGGGPRRSDCVTPNLPDPETLRGCGWGGGSSPQAEESEARLPPPNPESRGPSPLTHSHRHPCLHLGVSPFLMKRDANLGWGLGEHPRGLAQLKGDSCKDPGHRRPGGWVGRKQDSTRSCKATRADVRLSSGAPRDTPPERSLGEATFLFPRIPPRSPALKAPAPQGPQDLSSC